MNEYLEHLFGGIGLFSNPSILVAVLGGCLFGMVLGAMPGVGLPLGYAVMLPFTFYLSPEAAIALLLSMSAGLMYSNGLPSVFLGVPGTPAAFLTAIDGYAMRRRGQAGLAVGVMWLSAIAGQWFSVLFFVAALVPLSAIAYIFLQPEMFALYVLGLVAVASLTGKNIFKGLAAVSAGILVSMVGTDPVDFVPRFTFGVFRLRDGLNEIAVLIGTMAVGEIFRQMRQTFAWGTAVASTGKLRFPKLRQLRQALLPIGIGTTVGTAVGAVPALGATPAAVISYQQAQVFSRRKDMFGKGSAEGVAANESAQNAAVSGELIPTFGLGIPGSSSMVFLLGAVTMHGFVPGPNLTTEAPELVHAAIAGLVGGAALIAILGWAAAKLLGKLLSVDRSVVLTLALFTSAVGVFSLQFRWLDVLVCFTFGAIGYFMIRYGYSTAAFVLGFILGPNLEASLRFGLNIVDNNFIAFVSRPMTAGILILAVIFAAFGVRRSVRAHRQHAQQEQEQVHTPDDRRN